MGLRRRRRMGREAGVKRSSLAYVVNTKREVHTIRKSETITIDSIIEYVII